MEKQKQRCINIDWLEIFCFENYYPMDAEFYRKAGYEVKQRDYGTPIYAEMFTVLIDGFPFIEVRRNPYSKKNQGGIFREEACHIKLANRQCYNENPIQDLLEVLMPLSTSGKRIELYTIRGISRIDICLDFIRFDTGRHPAEFLKEYMANKFSKIGQSHITSHGKDAYLGKYWNSISWGSVSSMCRTKMYNKSLELKEMGHKMYIRQAWVDAGLLHDLYDDTEIWRIEFSLNSDCKHFISEKGENGDRHSFVIANTLSTYDTREKILTIFHSLKEHYFRFVKQTAGLSKYKAPQMITFYHKQGERVYKPIPNSPKKDIGRTEKLLIKKLRALMDEHTTHPFIIHSIELLITALWGTYADKKLFAKDKANLLVSKDTIRKDLEKMLQQEDFRDLFLSVFQKQLTTWQYDASLSLNVRQAASIILREIFR